MTRQQAFFDTHLAPRYAHCLNDLAAAPGADFYLLVAALVDVFFDIEPQAFEMGGFE